jgi:predicted ATPase/DNA-binding XRE family transcriptional regulator
MTAQETQSFGTLLRHLRQGASLSQEMLAERAGLSTDAISRLERGQRTARLETVRLLAEALGLGAAERTSLLAAAHPEARPTQAPTERLSTLPSSLTPLIGREREEAAVVHLLGRSRERAPVRLLTLTGPGGVGKTRLAVQVAAGLGERFPDGIVFVGLASLGDPGLVLVTIAQGLGLRDSGTRSLLQTVMERLEGQEMLLLLDNCEHLLPAAPMVTELLGACPELVVLATSRAALRVQGEQEYAVPPLALPDPAIASSIAGLQHTPAVELFVQRAQAVKPEFALNETNAEAVAALCAQLDGLPLAIELAAARIKVFGPRALLMRLSGSTGLGMLVGGGRDLPARQQTLEATIAWSYDLLSAWEQALFRRLSVCAGGCTLEAAEAIGSLACNSAQPAESGDVLAEVMGLVGHSLLRSEEQADGEPRFRMLETIREYGLERLIASGEEDGAWRAHATHYLELAETAQPVLLGSEQGIWLERLEREQDNLRAALAWAHDQGAWETGLRLAGALGDYWWQRGHFTEGRSWLEALLAGVEGEHAEQVANSVRATALFAAGQLAIEQGDLAVAATHLEQSLDLYRRLGDTLGIARVLNGLGTARREQGQIQQATTLYDESLALYQAMGATRGIAVAQLNRGVDAYQEGDFEEARARHEDSLRLFQQAEDATGSALALSNLAFVSSEQGDAERAAGLAKQALALAREMGDQRVTVLALLAVGQAAREQGDPLRARQVLEEAIELSDGLAYAFGCGVGRAGLAVVRQDLGDGRGAVACGDEAVALLRGLGYLWGLLFASSYRGRVALAQGDTVVARTALSEGLALARRLRSSCGVPVCLEGLAAVAEERGGPELAARLLAAAGSLRARQGAPVSAVDRPRYDALVAAVRAALEDAPFEAAWAAGQALSAEEAIDEALLGG